MTSIDGFVEYMHYLHCITRTSALSDHRLVHLCLTHSSGQRTVPKILLALYVNMHRSGILFIPLLYDFFSNSLN